MSAPLDLDDFAFEVEHGRLPMSRAEGTALLDECRRQRNEIARLREALDECRDAINSAGCFHDCEKGWMACRCGFAAALRKGNKAARAALGEGQ